MKIEKTWTATSDNKEKPSNDILTNLAGKWGVGIEVRITNPYTYSNDYKIENVVDDQIKLEGVESD